MSSEPTSPKIPIGDASIESKDVERLIEAVPPGMILVGGQALSFWLSFYKIDLPTQAIVTADVDFLGSFKDAKLISQLVSGILVVPPKEARTAIVAQIRLPTSDPTKSKNIDVIHQLFMTGGLRKSVDFTKAVTRRATLVDYEKRKQFLIMHPLDVLISRVVNAAGLYEEKGPHVVTQAQWAIELIAKALLAGKLPTQRIGSVITEIYRLANGSAGRALYKEHGIEVMNAAPLDQLVRRYPELENQISRVKIGMSSKRELGDATIKNYFSTRQRG